MSRLDGELEKRHPNTLNAIKVMFTTYPRVDQLLAFDTTPQTTGRTVRYHTSYFRNSTTDHYSRSWLLANVHVVMQQLTNYRDTLFDDFSAISRERGTKLYDLLLHEYNVWETLAKANLKTPLEWLQNRELTGRRSTIDELLQELRCCHT
jgi:hypothetical protein